jgi:hypothetical protein
MGCACFPNYRRRRIGPVDGRSSFRLRWRSPRATPANRAAPITGAQEQRTLKSMKTHPTHGFPFKHELPEERAGRHELVKQLSRQFKKVTEEELRQGIEKLASELRTHRSIASTHQLLAALFELYLFYVAKKMLVRRLRKYRKKSKIRLNAGTHVFTAIVRAEYPTSKDAEIEWVRAIRYATIKRILPEELPQFLKAHGGIGRSGDRFNTLLNPRKSKAATLVRPQSGEVPIAATPYFRSMLRRQALEARDGKKHLVNVVGSLNDRRLTLRFVRSFR